MNSRELLDQLARNARYPVIPRVRTVTGIAHGSWILLGAYRDRNAAQNAVSAFLQSHQGQSFQAGMLEFSNSEYQDALMQVRQMRRTRSRSRLTRF